MSSVHRACSAVLAAALTYDAIRDAEGDGAADCDADDDQLDNAVAQQVPAVRVVLVQAPLGKVS